MRFRLTGRFGRCQRQEPSVGFMWENGRRRLNIETETSKDLKAKKQRGTDDLRLKTWRQETVEHHTVSHRPWRCQDLCKRHHNCVTIEIHIRPADSFSAGPSKKIIVTVMSEFPRERPRDCTYCNCCRLLATSLCHCLSFGPKGVTFQ